MNKKLRGIYRAWVTSSMNGFHSALCVLAIALYFAAGLLKAPTLRPVGILIFVVDAVSYLVHMNQSRIYSYVNSHQRVTHFPEKQMQRRNNVLLALFLVIGIAASVCALLLPCQEIVAWLKRLLYQCVSAILLAIFKVRVYEGNIAEENKSQLGGEAAQWKPSSTAMADAMEHLMVSAALMVVLVLVCYLVYYLWCRFMYRRRTSLAEETAMDDQAEIRTRVRKEKKHRVSIFDRSPNAQVRRRYMRTLRTGFGKAVPKDSMTPTELETFAGVDQSIGGLHDLYVQARYSEEGCTQEDVQKYKESLEK